VDEFITSCDSQSEAYRAAFAVFLQHTDQKAVAYAWLDRLVQTLPGRNTFIDVGAASGALTARFLPVFNRTIAIEPSAPLREDLRRACPAAEVIPDRLMDARPGAAGDFVLCSHVFYYVPPEHSLDHLRRLVSWLAPGGAAVLILQNPGSDCMRLETHFQNRTAIDLAALGEAFRADDGGRHEVAFETVASRIESADLADAMTIAQFMLNTFPLTCPLPRRVLEEYVRQYFLQPGGGYRFSCDQDFLTVRRRDSAGPSH
jgi:hypothetical protein